MKLTAFLAWLELETDAHSGLTDRDHGMWPPALLTPSTPAFHVLSNPSEQSRPACLKGRVVVVNTRQSTISPGTSSLSMCMVSQVSDFLQRVKSRRFPTIEKDMKMVLAHCGSLFLDPASLMQVGLTGGG